MKSKIKLQNLLREMTISEEKINGLDVTKKAQKKSKTINDANQTAAGKEMKAYEEPVTPKEDKDIDKMNKPGNIEGDDKTYHDEMEILNGQEMIDYGNDPNKQFEDRQEMALKGDSKMGNKTYTGKWNPETGEGNGNTEEVWGASGGKHTGEEIYKNTAASKKKRAAAEEKINSPQTSVKNRDLDDTKINEMVDEVSQAMAGRAAAGAKSSWNDNHASNPVKAVRKHQQMQNFRNYVNPEIKSMIKHISSLWGGFLRHDDIHAYNGEEGNILVLKFYPHVGEYVSSGMKSKEPLEIDILHTSYEIRKGDIDMFNDKFKRKLEAMIPKIQEKLANTQDTESVNENKTKKKTKNKMKRLRFKKNFDGLGNALNLIPENYKVDAKEFEMTDGNESYTMRWEGNLSEGKAVVLKAADQNMINEDMAHMKHLMGFNSNDTLGTLKGSDRINEDESFKDVWGKTKSLLNENASSVGGMGFVSEDLEEDVDITEDDKVSAKVSHAKAEGPIVMNEDEPLGDEEEGWEDELADGAPSGEDVFEGAFDFLNKKKSEPEAQEGRVLNFKEWWGGHYEGKLTPNDKVEFEGQFFSVANSANEIQDDDYQSTGEVPRIESGVLVVPNRHWSN